MHACVRARPCGPPCTHTFHKLTDFVTQPTRPINHPTQINPGVMLYIFPNVAIQLGAEDEGLRARAVALLGRLFAATHAEYGQEYPRIFREFLGRFKDKEPAIRSQLVGIGAAIMQRKPRLADQIVPHLQGRLQDPVRCCCCCWLWFGRVHLRG